MLGSVKKLFLGISARELIFPVIRILIILLFLISLIFSLRFIYKIVNETLIVKPAVTQKPFFDIDKFKKVAPLWGISIED
jgi:hypothetical protein